MLKPRFLLLLFILLFTVGWLFSADYCKQPRAAVPVINSDKKSKLNADLKEKIRAKAGEARAFIEKKDYSESVCFLVDMNLPSGQNRFFIYDLKNDSVKNAGLVTHGSCNQYWLQGRKYGNSIGCGCTSLGKYRVGGPYSGKFGLAFKLYGLDKTNDNALARYVVLHSHDCVPESEVKDEICQSLGCPTVAPGFLQNLKTVIVGSRKPIILWIFE